MQLNHTPTTDERQDAARALLVAEINGLLDTMDAMSAGYNTHIAHAIQTAHLTYPPKK